MKEREDSIKEIMAWLAGNKEALGLKRIKYDPVAPVDPKKLNGVHVHVGKDRTVKETNKYGNGYPKIQQVQVIFEAWLKDGYDHVDFYQQFIKTIFSEPLSNRNVPKVTGTFGPFDGGVPGAQVMQIFMDLQYTDHGPYLQ